MKMSWETHVTSSLVQSTLFSASVNSLLKSGDESNRVIESDLKRCERDLDRASQTLKQSNAEEEKLINEVEQLRKKIFDVSGCFERLL